MELKKILTTYVFLSLISLITASCQTKDSKLVLNAIHKGTYRLSPDESKLYFMVEVRLINNSDFECKFLASSCTTGANVVVDSKQINICPNQCSENYPIQMIINPNHEFTITVILQSDMQDLNLALPIRFGFVLVPSSNGYSGDFYEIRNKMIKNQENVVWSDPVFLSIAGGTPYEN